MKMFVIFSHKLTNTQIEDAKKSLRVSKFIHLPKELQDLWSNVDQSQNINDFLLPIKKFIAKNYKEGDYVLIQGDFGATCNLVTFCKNLNLKAIYSTTLRKCKEKVKENGEVEKISYFSHISYKEYLEDNFHQKA